MTSAGQAAEAYLAAYLLALLCHPALAALSSRPLISGTRRRTPPPHLGPDTVSPSAPHGVLVPTAPHASLIPAAFAALSDTSATPLPAQDDVSPPRKPKLLQRLKETMHVGHVHA
ncbi:hypothetical protein B0H17DRAFT_1221454 [Mycena rosella]|uniref:Uncharacterized protein n=1 Tax=Mycena rosella TaxID=1033263 RepID=A0AAD7B361_MYCRO|nr:hypothetical protein B0H17DRAFT_1221454 [Mycena rosella]